MTTTHVRTKAELLEKAARLHDAEFRLHIYAFIHRETGNGWEAHVHAARVSGKVKALIDMAQHAE